MKMRAGLDEPPLPDLSFLIPAAGCGERLGLGPKALLSLDGKPLVSWLARKALGVATEVIIAVQRDHLDQVADLCPDCQCIPGGGTRQETIACLVAASTKPWLLVQDIVRPFATTALMRAVAAKARETGAAGAFLHPDVPVARIQDGFVMQDFRPDEVGVFQAPQAFGRALLLEVLAEAAVKGWSEQSTMQLVLRAGIRIRSVPGEKTNLKLTTVEDWKLATSLTEWLT